MEKQMCEHPLDKIRVVWHFEKNGFGYKIGKPHAHCLACSSTLQPTEKNAILAIDLVIASVGRKAKYAGQSY